MGGLTDVLDVLPIPVAVIFSIGAYIYISRAQGTKTLINGFITASEHTNREAARYRRRIDQLETHIREHCGMDPSQVGDRDSDG